MEETINTTTLMLKIECSIIIFLLTGMISCANEEISLAERYTGYWAETQFDYYFYPNNEFVFKTLGHFGNTTTEGKYAVIDSIILIYPYTDWNVAHGVLKNRLVIKSENGCIRDYENNFYCENVDVLNKVSEEYFILLDSIKNRLFELDAVKEIMNQSPDSSRFDTKYPRFRYDGITLINNNEFHGFQLEEINEESNWLQQPFLNVQNQYYLISINENMIFRHHVKGDSLSFVDQLFGN
ncbi:MAG: hypothetical protein JNK77_13930 [Saprospiraceae bacterium]|nr:hypothetical protein [Saprospiraceae bacterium]